MGIVISNRRFYGRCKRHEPRITISASVPEIEISIDYRLLRGSGGEFTPLETLEAVHFSISDQLPRLRLMMDLQSSSTVTRVGSRSNVWTSTECVCYGD